MGVRASPESNQFELIRTDPNRPSPARLVYLCASFTKLSEASYHYGCRLDNKMTTRTLITTLVALTVASAWSATNDEPKLQPVTLAVTGMT